LFSSVQDSKAFGSLILARIVYAVNWLNFGAIFYLMSTDVGAGVSGLGNITSVFYLGLGLLQVPGGILAAKFGPKKIVVVGIFLSSFAVIGTAVSSTVLELEVLRFFAGAGMAFVFAPGVVIVTHILRGEKSGMGVGLFNSAYDIGGIMAIFGWVVIAVTTGWRPSLALSGGLYLVTGFLVIAFVPGDDASEKIKIARKSLFSVILDRQMVLMGLGILGFSIGNTLIAGFMVYYLERSLSVAGTVAALVTSVITFIPIFTSIWGGRVYDTVSNHRLLMIVSMLASAGSLAIVGIGSVYAAVVAATLGGVVSGFGFTFAFAGARDFNKAGKEYESLAIAWVNSIQLTGEFFPPLFFSYLAEQYGYSQAWLWSAVLTLAFIVPVLMTVENWRAKAASR
jgi:MFS family permease